MINCLISIITKLTLVILLPIVNFCFVLNKIVKPTLNKKSRKLDHFTFLDINIDLECIQICICWLVLFGLQVTPSELLIWLIFTHSRCFHLGSDKVFIVIIRITTNFWWFLTTVLDKKEFCKYTTLSTNQSSYQVSVFCFFHSLCISLLSFNLNTFKIPLEWSLK